MPACYGEHSPHHEQGGDKQGEHVFGNGDVEGFGFLTVFYLYDLTFIFAVLAGYPESDVAVGVNLTVLNAG